DQPRAGAAARGARAPGVSRGARRAVLQPRDLLRSGRLRASAGRGVLWRARRPRGATPPRGDVDRGGVRARSTYPTLLLVAGTTPGQTAGSEPPTSRLRATTCPSPWWATRCTPSAVSRVSASFRKTPSGSTART